MLTEHSNDALDALTKKVEWLAKAVPAIESIVARAESSYSTERRRWTEVSLLVFSSDVSVEVLRAVQNAAESTFVGIALDVETMRPTDLLHAADAFALEFLALRADHLDLVGESPVGALFVDRDNVRLDCERQLRIALKSLLLLERTSRLDVLQRQLSGRETVEEAIAPLGGLLYLEHGTYFTEPMDVIRLCSTLLRVDSDALMAFLHLGDDDLFYPEELDLMEAAAGRYLRAAVEFVDQLENRAW